MSSYNEHHKAENIDKLAAKEKIAPDKDPTKRICYRCNKSGANRWDGGNSESIIVINGKEEKLPTPLYICDKCDKNNMWTKITD